MKYYPKDLGVSGIFASVRSWARRPTSTDPQPAHPPSHTHLHRSYLQVAVASPKPSMSDAFSTLFTTRPKPELLPLILKYASSPLSFSPQPFTLLDVDFARWIFQITTTNVAHFTRATRICSAAPHMPTAGRRDNPTYSVSPPSSIRSAVRAPSILPNSKNALRRSEPSPRNGGTVITCYDVGAQIQQVETYKFTPTTLGCRAYIGPAYRVVYTPCSGI